MTALEGPPRLADLADSATVRDRPWTAYTIAELMDHLVATHHGYLVGEVPRLLTLGARVADAHGAAEPHLIEVLHVLDRLDEELGPHLATEEEVLFPWCRRLLAGEPVGDWVAARLRCMRREHRSTDALLEELRRLTGSFAVPADASGDHRAFLVGLAGFDADLRLHIHKEEHVLFPAIGDLLERTAPDGADDHCGR